MAKKEKYQTLIEYYAFWTLFTGLRLFPRKIAVGFGAFCAYISYFCFPKLRNVGIQNVKLAFPEADSQKCKHLVLGCFRSLGRQLGEISQFPKVTEKSLNNIIEYKYGENVWEQYKKAKADKRGIIILVPHLGGWEVLAFAASVFHEPHSYLARRLDNPKVDKMVKTLRERFGNRSIDKKGSAVTALNLLRQGGTLGILADFNSLPNEGVFVPFFGHSACTTAGIAALVMRTSPLVILACAPWDKSKKKYVLRYGPILEFESTGDRIEDVHSFTARFTKEFEKMVREYPDQWLWIHRRWKTRPPGEPDLY